MGEPRIILLEKVEKIDGYSAKWWEENMPEHATGNVTRFYRKRGAKVLDIKAVLEIPGNNKECEVLFHDGEEITVNGSFAEVYEAWIDAEEQFFEDCDDENYPSYD